MIGTIVKPQPRGQITLPKEYREKLGITPQTPLNVTLEEDRIIVKPLTKVISDMQESRYTIKPKYTRREYLKILEKYAKSKTRLWTEEDDKAREEMKKKEKLWDW